MALVIILSSVACKYFGVTGEFLYSLKFHLTVHLTFDRFAKHPREE
jgi:hypothetical protein